MLDKLTEHYVKKIHTLLNEEIPPWGQMAGHGKIKTDFADTRQTELTNSNPWESYNCESILDESAPLNFPKKLYNKIKKQYPGNMEAAYATMWKVHNKMEERVEEINKIQETSSTGGSGVGMGIMTPNAFAGKSHAGHKKMKDNATNSTGYQLTGKIEKADKMEEGEN